VYAEYAFSCEEFSHTENAHAICHPGLLDGFAITWRADLPSLAMAKVLSCLMFSSCTLFIILIAWYIETSKRKTVFQSTAAGKIALRCFTYLKILLYIELNRDPTSWLILALGWDASLDFSKDNSLLSK
jgi:hypothetical protein